ncbi:MAG: DUF4286 family protein, partial [Muribaculaceae bacterium]|nr:DUF4286 family protein [Muribaculaceae bacterium]
EEKDAFLEWMRGEALPELVNESLPAREPRLTLLAEVPGDPDFASQAASFAFQVEFDSQADAEKWAETALQPVAGRFTEKFGTERAVIFTTILRKIAL